MPTPEIVAIIPTRIPSGQFAVMTWDGRPHDDGDDLIKLTSRTYFGELKGMFRSIPRAVEIYRHEVGAPEANCVSSFAVPGTIIRCNSIVTAPWGEGTEFASLADSLQARALSDEADLKIWTPPPRR